MTTKEQKALTTARVLLANAIENQDANLIVSLVLVIKKLVLTNRQVGLANGDLLQSPAMNKFVHGLVTACASHLRKSLDENEVGDLINNNIAKLIGGNK